MGTTKGCSHGGPALSVLRGLHKTCAIGPIKAIDAALLRAVLGGELDQTTLQRASRHGYYELNTRATSPRLALARLKQLPQHEARGPLCGHDFIEGTRVAAEGELHVKGRNSTRCSLMERVR